MRDPADQIRQFFPGDLLNFDVTPPGAGDIGPLHAIFKAAGTAIGMYMKDVLLLQAQLSVQTATGPYLINHGLTYGVAPVPSESDDDLRTRILQAMSTGRVTCPAIQAAIENYLASIGKTATVYVWDAQMEPALATLYGITVKQFVIDIAFDLPRRYNFFANRGFANRGFLFDTNIVSTAVPADGNLVAIVLRNKGAGYRPIWHTHPIFTNAY